MPPSVSSANTNALLQLVSRRSVSASSMARRVPEREEDQAHEQHEVRTRIDRESVGALHLREGAYPDHVAVAQREVSQDQGNQRPIRRMDRAPRQPERECRQVTNESHAQ